ncbi:DNA-3-methyladenine glycosylase II [Pseudomonas duriflava]|uniref:DNA-3-methyladenine glycosylase II n=1 Tax=Pseudomonas duriflava TaxID=459528 RepID=A0A562QJ02_9PSED|nr:DNA-3-methyladenine glycosylase 2 [Pseudomonas duriflava]TWI56653.1 DNA-3-methyladenine glycosylase II [Pseudomonas duriflava]
MNAITLFSPTTLLYERARLSRDARFDGLFYTAVITTGIYCRPVCPAPAPRAENVRYYSSAAAAEAEGFRPCLRCRPELSPARHVEHAVLARALALIEDGVLDDASISDLAARLFIGERQLRRLFNEHLGVSPRQVQGTRRLLFAKQLLSETCIPITEIALASGFRSLRRFNSAFQAAYRLAPRQIRAGLKTADNRPTEANLTLRLTYRPPFDFQATLEFLHGHALPGVEIVTENSYSRLIGNPLQPGWLRVSPWPGEQALRLELHGATPARLLGSVQRIRRMFDLDADPQAIAAVLSCDPQLQALLTRRPGLRLASGWDGFEIAVRAVIGQQVSVAAARTMTARLVQRFGEPWPQSTHEEACPPPEGLDRFFPTVETLANAQLEDLTALGLIRSRSATLLAVARGLRDGSVDFAVHHSLDDFSARWDALPGIGPWTAQYIALRALGHPDAFPAEDLVLQRAAGTGERLSARALQARAEAWRPWRGYAVMQLWRDATERKFAAPANAFQEDMTP